MHTHTLYFYHQKIHFFPFMTALKAVTETKWHLSLSPCDKNVFHVWGMFWQHFPNFGLTPAQVLVNEFS